MCLSADRYKILQSSAVNILRRSEQFLADYASKCNKSVKRRLKNENNQTIYALRLVSSAYMGSGVEYNHVLYLLSCEIEGSLR